MVLKNDPVHYPMHYTQGKVECIDAIESSMTLDAFCGFLKGNALKYIWRYEKKGKAVEDLEKAQWYISKLIDVLTEEKTDDD